MGFFFPCGSQNLLQLIYHKAQDRFFSNISKKKDTFICVEVIIFKTILTEILVNLTIYHHD